MAIDWEHLGQPNFDRHIEALLHRRFQGPDGEVTAVNGRGGDQGIDVKVERPDGLRIFQLKYYPEGFSNGFQPRRTKIKSSLRTALRHQPVEWTLVVPCNLSLSEHAFLGELGRDHTVRVTVMDRAQLDSEFAAQPELEAAFTRDLLREAARDIGHEQALLLDPDDLADRVRALGARADGVDPDWTWDFRKEGNTVISTLRAQHPRAHLVSPITIQITSRPEAVTADLNAAINRSLGFGITEEVRLPAETVESLTIDGPPWVARTVANPEVIWKPAPASAPASRPGAGVGVTFHHPDGTLAAHYTGHLRTLGAGSVGASIDADVHGGRLQLLLPFDSAAPARLRYEFDLNGREPTEGTKILGMYLRLLQGGGFRVTVDDIPAGAGTLEPSGTDDERRVAEQIFQYLADLEVVQRHCENYFPAPLDIPVSERVHVRIARLILDGHCVVYPRVRTVSFTLNGQDHPTLHALLSGEPQCLRVSPPHFDLSVGAHTLSIGPVHLFHTQLRPDDGPQTLAELKAGRGAGLEVTLRPATDEGFRIYHARQADDRPLIPTPLALDGFPEPA